MVTYPATPSLADPGALTSAARTRAGFLAKLLGGAVGESLGTAKGPPPVQAINIISGDFSGLFDPSNPVVLPVVRVIPVISSVREPVGATSLRYRFSVVR